MTTLAKPEDKYLLSNIISQDLTKRHVSIPDEARELINEIQSFSDQCSSQTAKELAKKLPMDVYKKTTLINGKLRTMFKTIELLAADLKNIRDKNKEKYFGLLSDVDFFTSHDYNIMINKDIIRKNPTQIFIRNTIAKILNKPQILNNFTELKFNQELDKDLAKYERKYGDMFNRCVSSKQNVIQFLENELPKDIEALERDEISKLTVARDMLKDEVRATKDAETKR